MASHHQSAQAPPDASDANSDGRAFAILKLAAAAWLVGFSIYFYWQSLPNNSSISRLDVWRETPLLLVDSVLPPLEGSAKDGAPKSGWAYLPQRFDLIAWAALVLAGSWHLGGLVLRGVNRISRGDGNSMESRSLRFALAGLTGLSAWSLIVLALGLAGVMNRFVTGGLLIAFIAVEWVLSRRVQSQAAKEPQRWQPPGAFGWFCLAIVAPFVLAMALGSMLPPTDFDVKAYHLVGPKEWFQAGRITFLPHNIYCSFPFLTEMLMLSTMELAGDWFRGALAGQLVLAMFAPLAAIVVFHLAAPFGKRASWLAAVIWLTIPWTCRISIIAYVEGALAAYLAATLLTYLKSRTVAAPFNRWTILCGLLAGSAASCKYPGVISALVPFGLMALIDGWRLGTAGRVRSSLLRAVVFSLAGLAAFGPWMLKNLAQTGNPVYPLLWGLFGGRGIDAALDAKFKAGHALPKDVITSPTRWLPDLWGRVWDIAVGSDWQSALIFGLLPACLLAFRPRFELEEDDHKRKVALTSGILFALWLFGTWWGLTHRIDRFWVPMLPVLAMLAGIGMQTMCRQLPDDKGLLYRARIAGNLAVLAAVAASVTFNLAFISTGLIGFNGYLMDERAARDAVETRGMKIINDLPSGSRILLIGEAEVFDARREVRYSTVFNRNLFEEWFAGPPDEKGVRHLKSADEIHEKLRAEGITHIFINWLEVLRYRTTYGYSDFVTPENVQALFEMAVTESHIDPYWPGVRQDLKSQPDSYRLQLETWGRELLRKDLPPGGFRFQFPVILPADADKAWFYAFEVLSVVPWEKDKTNRADQK